MSSDETEAAGGEECDPENANPQMYSQVVHGKRNEALAYQPPHQ
jgi:hypothetical protein